MTESNNAINNKNAWLFLNTYKKNSHVNLIAIHPKSLTVTGITAQIEDVPTQCAVYRFIERHNGTHNLYFMVNTPFKNAPNTKLKKEHVEFINAIFIDADPSKDKPFEKERKRLLQFAERLKDDDNPPSLIIDSGGGIQAFWWLKEPVAVTDKTRHLYEGYSRGLAVKYDTDRVQNIDRIMRLPYTYNLPTEKKAKTGRVKTLSKFAQTGERYEP